MIAEEETDLYHFPKNLEVEQALLGAIFENNDCFHKIQSFFKGEYFHDPGHQRNYLEVSNLIDKGHVADVPTLRPIFDQDPGLKEMGGSEYIVRVAFATTTTIDVSSYARTTKELWQRRVFIESCFRNGGFAQNLNEPLDEIVKGMEDDLDLVAGHEAGLNTRLFQDIANSALDQFEAATQKQEVLGIPTGLNDLDNMIGGLMNKRLYIPAGRTGMAKSVLAVNIALNAAQASKNVLLMSPEMGAEEVGARAMSNMNKGHRVEYQSMERGKAGIQILADLRAQMDKTPLPLYINDKGSINVDDIVYEVRRLNRILGVKNQRLDLVIVDHMHRLRGKRRQSKFDVLDEIPRVLKNLAKEHDLPVVCFAQLNRAVEHRDNRRPELSDLRGAGTIEEEADCVLFLYREHYYLSNKKPDKKSEIDGWMVDCEDCKHDLEIIVAKQRSGPTYGKTFYIDLGISKITDKAHG